MTDPKKKLRNAVWRRARAWVEVYKPQPNAQILVKSLLVGIERGVARRAGTLPKECNGGYSAPDGLDGFAYMHGQEIANEIPFQLIAPFSR